MSKGPGADKTGTRCKDVQILFPKFGESRRRRHSVTSRYGNTTNTYKYCIFMKLRYGNNRPMLLLRANIHSENLIVMKTDKQSGIGVPACDLLPEGTDERLLTFFDTWRASRHGALVPSKRDFDPFEVPSLLRYAWLYRFDPEAGDFVCLLAGEDVNRAWGGPIKGKTLREVVGEKDHPIVLERWRAIVDTPLVQYGAKDEKLSNQDLWRAERLLLPLASAGDRPDHVIGISLYRLAAQEEARAPLISEDILQMLCTDI